MAALLLASFRLMDRVLTDAEYLGQRGGPEARQGALALPVVPPALIELADRPVQRHSIVADAHRASVVAAAAVAGQMRGPGMPLPAG